MHSLLLRRGLVVTAIIAIAVVGASGVTLLYIVQSPRSPDSVQVLHVWTDGVDAPSGMMYYLLYVNATSSLSSAWSFDPSYLSLTSNTSSYYSPVDDYTIVAMLKPTVISPGGHIIGYVIFLLPKSESPSKLNYDEPGVSLQAGGVPAVSAEASKFDPSVHVKFNGTSAADATASWDGITNQTNALQYFAGPSYSNYTLVAFTGQKIYVTFTIYYYKFPNDPNSITVDSVVNDDGYVVSDLTAWEVSLGVNLPHPLPVTLTGYGSSVSITALVTVPPGPQPGVLHFTIQFSN